MSGLERNPSTLRDGNGDPIDSVEVDGDKALLIGGGGTSGSVKISAADKNLLADVVGVLCDMLIELRKISAHLQAGSDIEPSGEE